MNRAERRRAQKNGPTRSAFGRVLGLGALLLCTVFVAILGYRMVNTQQVSSVAVSTQEVVSFGPEEINELANTIINGLDTRNTANAYFPPFVTEKLDWFLVSVATKQMGLLQTFEGSTKPGQFSTMMFAGRTGDGKPLIGIRMVPMMAWIRMEDKTPRGQLTREQKNSLALMFTHEMVHLEPEKLGKGESLDEEVRTYFKVNMLAVRPFLEKGEPLRREFVVIDSIIRSCGDKPCEAFRQHLLKGTPTM